MSAIEVDNDTIMYRGLRVYRNEALDYCRERLVASLETAAEVDRAIKELFVKEWPEIERSANLAHQSGAADREPADALDFLSVNQIPGLLEKFWDEICPFEDPKAEAARKLRNSLLTWARELTAVRNPVSHSPQEELGLSDLMRYLDSARRFMQALSLPGAEAVSALWQGLIEDYSADAVAPLALIDNLPSRESITSEFVGRDDQLSDLWSWIGDVDRRIWALIGDGGKGKTTIAYEFATNLKPVAAELGLQGLIWMSAKQRRFVEGETVSTAQVDFSTLDGALDLLLTELGWTDELELETTAKRSRVLELLREFPMFIVADDIDSLYGEDEEAIQFLSMEVPATKSKVLLTSRRRPFGLGASVTEVVGMAQEEVRALLDARCSSLGLPREEISPKLVDRVARVTDGSPLYIEDLLRLARFYSLNAAIEMWSGRSGDAARRYSLQRELELLSEAAQLLLGVIAYSPGSVSLQECLDAVGDVDEADGRASMQELINWNLVTAPSIVEDVPRYEASRNLSKLMKSILQGTDQELRIKNGLKGLRGISVGKTKVGAHIRQAVALQRGGKLDESERTLLKALSEVPNSGEVHAMLGWLYSKWTPSPRLADASDNFHRAVALGAQSRDLYAHWSDMQLRAGEFRAAIEICEMADAGPAPDDAFLWRTKGRALTRSGELAERGLNAEAARSLYREADIALRRAQKLCSEGSQKSDGDLSRTFTSRLQLARVSGSDRDVKDVLAEWRLRLPKDPYRPSS